MGLLTDFQIQRNELRVISTEQRRAAEAAHSGVVISQGRVATQSRPGGIFNNYVIANLPPNVPVEENRSLFQGRYGQKLEAYVFWPTLPVA